MIKGPTSTVGHDYRLYGTGQLAGRHEYTQGGDKDFLLTYPEARVDKLLKPYFHGVVV